jgi:excinuclease ABC subunit A
LELTIEDALKVFHFIPAMKHMLKTLCDIHLGYLKLGQNATTLSGGEAQRLKLGRILGVRKQTNSTLYILDEPTTGLHFDDIQALLQVLRTLTLNGNSVIIIEHHIDILRQMDWLIELGPYGGKDGGHLIAQGTCEELIKQNTPTGKFL